MSQVYQNRGVFFYPEYRPHHHHHHFQKNPSYYGNIWNNNNNQQESHTGRNLLLGGLAAFATGVIGYEIGHHKSGNAQGQPQKGGLMNKVLGFFGLGGKKATKSDAPAQQKAQPQAQQQTQAPATGSVDAYRAQQEQQKNSEALVQHAAKISDEIQNSNITPDDAKKFEARIGAAHDEQTLQSIEDEVKGRAARLADKDDTPATPTAPTAPDPAPQSSEDPQNEWMQHGD